MIDDQDLILYHYDDGLAPEQRQRIALALADDPALAARLRQLRAELSLLDPPAQATPAPPAMEQRWRAALAREARITQPAARVKRWAWLRQPGLSSVAAAAVLVSFGIGIGQWLDGRPDPRPQLVPQPLAVPDAQSERSPLLRGVQLHLQDTQDLLPQLNATTTASQRRSLLAETRAQNRMYTTAAQAQNDEQLARVLRAFDAALASLALERADPEALAADQAQLSFELAIMQTKLARDASNNTQL